MRAASQRGSRCWRKTLARYGEAGPKRALCVEAGTKGQVISRTDSEIRAVSRCYREGTLVLDTEFETDTGAVVITDFMPLPSSEDEVDVVRIVRGLRGEVPGSF